MKEGDIPKGLRRDELRGHGRYAPATACISDFVKRITIFVPVRSRFLNPEAVSKCVFIFEAQASIKCAIE
jgi:hypothetical protein